MAVKAKRFRIGVEGATTDGRNIERAWLEQMAASYDPQVYTALINLEHIKGYTPDSPFRRFGTVDKRKRAARTVLTGMCYSVGSATRQGSSSLTRFIGQSAITSSTWRR